MIKVEIGKARKPSKLGKNHLLGLTNKLRISLNPTKHLAKGGGWNNSLSDYWTWKNFSE